MVTVNATIKCRERKRAGRKFPPGPSEAGNGRGRDAGGRGKPQAAFEIFSAARLMRPEIGAKASLASLSAASVFFEL